MSLWQRARAIPFSMRVILGVGAGLFAARELGEFIPDSLAASIAMFAAGYLVGVAEWRAHRAKH